MRFRIPSHKPTLSLTPARKLHTQEYVMDIVGALEHDPDFKTPQKHREFLQVGLRAYTWGQGAAAERSRNSSASTRR